MEDGRRRELSPGRKVERGEKRLRAPCPVGYGKWELGFVREDSDSELGLKEERGGRVLRTKRSDHRELSTGARWGN